MHLNGGSSSREKWIVGLRYLQYMKMRRPTSAGQTIGIANGGCIASRRSCGRVRMHKISSREAGHSLYFAKLPGGRSRSGRSNYNLDVTPACAAYEGSVF